MRQGKKLFSLVVVLVLAVSALLAACSGKNNSSEGTQSSASPSASASATATPEPTPLPIIDVAVSAYSVNLDNVAGIAEDRIKKYIEDKFRINLTYKTGTPEDYLSKIMTSMAAGEASDVIAVGIDDVKEVYPSWVKEELVVDIGKIVNANPERYKAIKLLLDQPYAKFYNEYLSGDPAAFYSIFSVSESPRAYGGYIFNGTYLKAVNKQLPTTIDEFVDVLRALKDGDPDGNGKADTAPFSFLAYGGTGFYGSLQPLFTSNDTQPKGIFQDSAGVWQDGAIADKSKEIYALLGSMYKEGLIDKEVMTNDPVYKLMDDFVAGKTAVIDIQAPHPGQYNWLLGMYKEKYPNATPEDVPMLAAPLKGFNGQYATDRSAPFRSQRMLFIPSSTKDPERVLDYVNYLLSDEGQNLQWYGIEGIHHTKDGSGNLVLNVDEYRKESLIYLPDTPDRLQYYFTATFLNERQFYMQIERDGGVVPALKNAKDLITERYGANPGLEYAQKVNENFLKLGFQAQEPYYNFISLPEDVKTIEKALDDIRNKWLMKFIIGQNDVEKDWDKYVAEYKAAGGDKLKEAYIASYEEQKSKFEAMQ